MTDAVARLTAALTDRYSIERELGQGGMATVYLAHDVRHDRKVALKVLRPELAAILGGERFLKEIRTTANLQHPHILALHDSGEADGQVYYVMPYVEGESLRDRITREKQLPVDDAVRIATEVAGALDYAHRHGVVHRDIKPENILLHEGQALVADFGIALAASRSDGGTRMTETGMSLGTPHYMAPEQAMGEREITPRADVYALGCVLYEMLVGEPPFTGPTAQAIVARVMTEQPRSLSLQRRTIPPHIEAAVGIALEKLPADRFTTAAQFAEALAGRSMPITRTAMAATDAAGPDGARWRRRFIVAAGLAALALGLGAWGWMRGGLTGAVTTWQYISLGDSVTLAAGSPALALSPDGSTLVVRDAGNPQRLWIKRRGELNATLIPGTERATFPTFSPDGQWIAFDQDGRLRKVRTGGGPVVTVADSAASNAFGGTAWLDDGTLVFIPPSLAGLRRVSEAGGAITEVLPEGLPAGLGAGFVTPLPGARGVLFQACSSGCITMGVHVADLHARSEKLLLADAAEAWYLPSGHLFYVRRDGVGLVAPFDLKRLELSGPAVPVLENVLVLTGFAQATWSRSGTLIYVRGGGPTAENTFLLVSRDGAARPIDTAWAGPFSAFALSPDGRRMAVGAGASLGGLNVWIKQLDHGPFTRLSFGGTDRRPAWSPDGRQVAFVRDTGNTSYVVARPADGSGPDRPMARLDRQVQEVAWSRDGKWLLLRTDNTVRGNGDIVGVRTTGDTTAVPLAFSSFTELHPALSPDGRWLAYASNESGTFEVYVRPFPNTGGGRWQVSNGGGAEPVWSRNGRELFYLDGANRVVAFAVAAGSTFSAGAPRTLFDASAFLLDAFHQSFDVTSDGRSFVFIAPKLLGATRRTPQIVRVDNWFADLRARLR